VHAQGVSWFRESGKGFPDTPQQQKAFRQKSTTFISAAEENVMNNSKESVVWQTWPLIIAGMLGLTVVSFMVAAWTVL